MTDPLGAAMEHGFMLSKLAKITLDFYAVRNKEGKWFRRKGYGGYGDTWVDDIKKARIYGKIGQARGIVSFFATRWPTYGVPEIIHFQAKAHEIINEDDRVEKAAAAKARKEAEYEKRRAEEKVKQAEKELKEAKERLAKAKLEHT